jgi:uncharacterized protein involved in outer membrane biogenesis
VKPAHRWLIGALAALVLLPLLAVALLPLLIDPDTLRPAMERQARERLGIPLQLQGHLKWTLWPALAVQSGAGALGEAGAEPPVRWSALNFTLQWPRWGLREWQLEGVQVDGLQVRLTRQADGRWNVARLLRAGAAPASASSGATRLHIWPLRLHDARIELHPDAASAPWVFDALEAQARIDSDDLSRHWTLQALQLDARVAGPPLGAGNAQPLSLRDEHVEFRALPEAQLQLAPLTVRWAGAELQLRAPAPLRVVALAGEGELQLHTDSLRDLLAASGVTAPPMRDLGVLKRLALATHWKLADADFALSALTLQLDDTRWQGSLGGHWRAPAAWRVDLQGDTLDADRYRRPSDDPGEPFELPVQALRALPLTGQLRLAELRAAGSTAHDARITLQ